MKKCAVAAVVAACLISGVPAAHASPVLKVREGKAKRVNDRFLPPQKRTALPRVPRGTRIVRARSASRPMARAASLTSKERKTYDGALRDARRTRDSLNAGTPRDELSAVIATAEGIDARGDLTSSRLNAIVTTLRRNSEFWASNPAPEPGTRVVFAGNPVVFEYYAARGLQIQPLGNFGKANALWSACRSDGDSSCAPLRELLDEMLRLASTRAGFTAWEYFFDFEGGVPPWISGMAQGTGIQALTRAWHLTGDSRYRQAATAALGAYETGPPTGVRRPATDGDHYLMYSYAPDLFIFNGFLQALVGLDVYRDRTGDPRGTALFRAGHAHAKWLVPYSDTGSWSLYSLDGPESNLNYHRLLRDILATLCKRVSTDVYCTTAERFTQYMSLR